MAIEAEALLALEKAREELIVREARRREILDWLQDKIGTGWTCTRCGYSTYHSSGIECADCAEPMPTLDVLAFKLHANGTDNVDLIETVRAEFDAERAFLPDPDLIHRSALAEDTARAAEGQIPEGWKLVPVEPTRAMRDEVSKAVDDFSREGAARLFAVDLYRAMLAAAPALPPTKEAADANR